MTDQTNDQPIRPADDPDEGSTFVAATDGAQVYGRTEQNAQPGGVDTADAEDQDRVVRTGRLEPPEA